ncbi:MAG: hypothetical protein DRQ08_07360 [Candidatus Latescibacterota bacterium]|nr:MAG: hypothetical protein DRQ08_07360 [Candidatus Latescibacterota bacterium]
MRKGLWLFLPMVIPLISGCELFRKEEEGIEPGTVKWEYTFPDGAPDIADVPALSNGTIYATTVGDGCWLYAINSSDGTQKWAFHMDSASWIGYPAVGEDGTVYVVADKLYAISPDGTKKWALNPPNRPGQAYRFAGAITIGEDGTVYATLYDALNPVPPEIIAVKPDGTLKWSITYGDLVTRYGFLEIGPDGTLYLFAEWGHAIYAFSTSTGDISWVYEMGNGATGLAAIDQNGVIYVPHSSELSALQSNGALLWETDLGAAPSSPVIGPDGTLYTKLMNDSLCAVNPSDGTVIWKKKGYEFGTQEIRAIVVDTNGSLYIHGAESYGAQGYTHLLYAFNRDGEISWKIHDIFCEWPPIIDSDNTIYVQTPSGITAIQGEANLSNSPWPRPYHDNRNTCRYEGS